MCCAPALPWPLQCWQQSAASPAPNTRKKHSTDPRSQPLPRGREADLENFKSPIPLVADESVLSLAELPALVGRFNRVNIKLDKCGGLTEGLAMVREARRLGLGVMVGNMMGSSLAMAPSFVIGQLCDVVDLDGPTFLKRDRKPGVTYAQGMIWVDEAVWGRVPLSSGSR